LPEFLRKKKHSLLGNIKNNTISILELITPNLQNGSKQKLGKLECVEMEPTICWRSEKLISQLAYNQQMLPMVAASQLKT
jgi:hypothetical protein